MKDTSAGEETEVFHDSSTDFSDKQKQSVDGTEPVIQNEDNTAQQEEEEATRNKTVHTAPESMQMVVYQRAPKSPRSEEHTSEHQSQTLIS